jgi:Ca2+-transporting ATPase
VTDPHGLVVARTVGLTAFGLTHVAFAFATKDEQQSVFTTDTLADKPLMVSAAAAIGVTVLATTLSPFQRLLNTTELELEHWLVCIAAALAIVAVSEVRKLVLRRSIPAAAQSGPEPSAYRRNVDSASTVTT